MSRFVIALLLAIPFFAVSCGAEGGGALPNPPVAKVGDVASLAAADRKLVRTVTLSIEVGDPDQARSRAEAAAVAKGGFVEGLEAREQGPSRECHLVLRVPAEHLDAVLAEIRALAGRVGSETQGVKDVTTQWIDLDARLIGLRATEQELLALLAESRERESGVEEIMSVHRELTEIRTRIEEAEGRRKTLGGQVAYATIDLTIGSDRAAGLLGLSFRPLKFAGTCLKILMAIFKFIGYALIFFVLVVLPLTLLIVVPLRLISRWRSRRAPPVPPLPTRA